MTITKSIYRRQQEKDITRLIKGQRILYSKSKSFNKINLIFIWICVAMGMCTACFNWISSYLPASMECVKAGSNLMAVITLIISFDADAMLAKFKNKAAQIQQYIDAVLYSDCIGNTIDKWGNVPTLPQIEDWIRKYQEDIDKMVLGPWYNDYSNEIPVKQVLNCQHENLRWEESLHDEFGNSIVLLIWLIVAIFMGVEFYNNARICWALVDIAPFLPAIRYLYSISSKIKKDKTRINKAMEEYYSIYRKIQNNQAVKNEDLIDLQTLIYENRRDSYPIPDWFHKLNERKNSLINS
jgi:hypothetical protein